MKCPHSLLCVSIIFASMSASAQQADPRAAYEAFRNQTRQQYADFRRQANRRYADFLRAAWTAYQANPERERPNDEVRPPVVMPDDSLARDYAPIRVHVEDEITAPRPVPQPQPVSPIPEMPQAGIHTFTYCGTPCSVRLGQIPSVALGDCSNEQLAKVWLQLAESEVMDAAVAGCLRLREQLHLCDWAYLNLLDAFAGSLTADANLRTYFAAYVYCQSGYQMRLARADGRLTLLYASRHAIYRMPFFVVDGTTYYPYGSRATRLQICKATFRGEQPLSLRILRTQRFASSVTPQRTFQSQRYPEVAAEVSVNANLLAFCDTYPSSETDDNFMTRWALYADTPMDSLVRSQLYPQLQSAISNLPPLEAAERLLNWVQTAFTYEYDEKVWGADRAFFAEETLYYPFCDCEDRAILFTRLVRDLLGMDAVLVYYPGHLASAVRFPDDEAHGDYLTLSDGTTYTIADPTYIGAPVGRTMRGMDNTTATVIRLHP